jgi:hypothetical protein
VKYQSEIASPFAQPIGDREDRTSLPILHSPELENLISRTRLSFNMPNYCRVF